MNLIKASKLGKLRKNNNLSRTANHDKEFQKLLDKVKSREKRISLYKAYYKGYDSENIK